MRPALISPVTRWLCIGPSRTNTLVRDTPQDGPDPADVSPCAPSTSLLVIPVASGTQAGSPLGSLVSSASSSIIDLGDGSAHQPHAHIVWASNRSGKAPSSSLAAEVSAPPGCYFPEFIPVSVDGWCSAHVFIW